MSWSSNLECMFLVHNKNISKVSLGKPEQTEEIGLLPDDWFPSLICMEDKLICCIYQSFVNNFEPQFLSLNCNSKDSVSKKHKKSKQI